jgi:hypothetical protein
MAWPKGKPRPEGAGRQKGSTNKATREIKAIAQEHGEKAILTLADLMVNAESDSAKIAAAKELLDRGFGKAAQAITGADGAPLIPPLIQFALDENTAD